MIVEDEDIIVRGRTMENNERLKELMYQHRIPQWKLADVLNVSDITVYRKLCRPMTDELYDTYLKTSNGYL